jgi:hypothetical protein
MWMDKINEMIANNYKDIIDSPTDLCLIMNRHGSDKGNRHHNYSRVYHYLFSHMREEKFNLFELGLGTNNINIPSNMGINGKPGASLRGWNDYFPNAEIRGADVDPAIVNGPNDTDRIKTRWVDQTNKQIVLKLWSYDIMNSEFKIMIDDGLHHVLGNITFFENSISKLTDDGIYIIEDVLPNHVNAFREYFDKFCTNSEYRYQLLDIPLTTNTADNRLIVISK